MDALDLVDDLRHAQVDRDARQRQGLRPRDAELALHQVEHRLGGLLGGGVEILVETEREPGIRGSRDRRAKVAILEAERERRTLERALDRGSRHLAVALGAVAVARHHQRSVDRDREVQGRAGDELLAVDVPAPAPRRGRRVLAGLRRRHPDHAEERRRADTALAEVPPVAVPRPGEGLSVCPRAPPVAWHDFVDAHHERLPLPRPADLDRAVERVTGAFGPLRLDVRVPEPARVRNLERDRPTGLDRLDRLVLAGEPAPHARGSWIHASAGASRTRRPIRCPSSPWNSHSDTACSWPLSSGAISAGT